MHGPRQTPLIISSVAGRMRLHVAALDADVSAELEATLETVRGIRRVQASSLTGNVLINFDPGALTAAEVSLLVAGTVRDLARPRADGLAAIRNMPPSRGKPKPPLPLRHLSDLIAVLVAFATAESPIGLLLAGVDALKLIDALVA